MSGLRPVWDALALLRQARDLLGDAPKARARVCLAIKSCEGAARHAELMRYRVPPMPDGFNIPDGTRLACASCGEVSTLGEVETSSGWAGRQWQCGACSCWYEVAASVAPEEVVS